MPNAQERLSFDKMLNALADVQRRKFLLSLLEHNPIDDSSVFTADAEADVETLKQHRITMQHVHLPKLADCGLINWEKDNHKVTKGPNFDEIRPFLELLQDHEDDLPPDFT